MKFWDSSALVTLLVEEAQSRACRDLYRADPRVVTWQFTKTEIVSALYKLTRREFRPLRENQLGMTLRRLDLHYADVELAREAFERDATNFLDETEAKLEREIRDRGWKILDRWPGPRSRNAEYRHLCINPTQYGDASGKDKKHAAAVGVWLGADAKNTLALSGCISFTMSERRLFSLAPEKLLPVPVLEPTVVEDGRAYFTLELVPIEVERPAEMLERLPKQLCDHFARMDAWLAKRSRSVVGEE